MSLIIPSPFSGGSGPVIRNSLAFNKADAGYLKFTPVESPTSGRKGIASFWMRGTGIFDGSSHDYRPFTVFQSSGNQQFACGCQQAGQIDFYQFSGSYAFRLTSAAAVITDRAWHHFLFAWDTTQAVSSDRLSVYVDGIKITAFSTENYPSLNLDTFVGSGRDHFIGRFAAGAATSEALVAQVVYQDGQVLSDISDYITAESLPVDVSGLPLGELGDIWNFTGETLSEIIAGSNARHVMTSSNIAASDQRIDVPDIPDGANQAGTFAIFDLSDADTVSVGQTGILATGNKTSDSIELSQSVTTGKWFLAVKPSSGASAIKLGLVNGSVSTPPGNFVDTANGWGVHWNLGASQISFETNNMTTNATWPVALTTDDYLIVAFDADLERVWLGVADVSTGLSYFYDGSGWSEDTPPTGTDQTYTVTGSDWRFAVTLESGATATLLTGAEQLLEDISVPAGFKFLSSANE